MSSVLAGTLLKEFIDSKKAAHNYLSALNRSLSWAKATEGDKLAGLHMDTSNNALESAFEALAENLTKL